MLPSLSYTAKRTESPTTETQIKFAVDCKVRSFFGRHENSLKETENRSTSKSRRFNGKERNKFPNDAESSHIQPGWGDEDVNISRITIRLAMQVPGKEVPR